MTAKISRRAFLATSAAIPAAFLTSCVSPKSNPSSNSTATAMPAPKKLPIGLELYSVRDELHRDLPNTLKQVSADGYQVVEFYAPYYEWSLDYAKDVRKQLDDLNLKCLSTHNSFASFKTRRLTYTGSC